MAKIVIFTLFVVTIVVATVVAAPAEGKFSSLFPSFKVYYILLLKDQFILYLNIVLRV